MKRPCLTLIIVSVCEKNKKEALVKWRELLDAKFVREAKVIGLESVMDIESLVEGE